MPSPSLESFQKEAGNLRAYLIATNVMRGIISTHPPSMEPSLLETDLDAARDAAPDTVRWRVMEHTLAVGHLYALYESFCEDLLRDWIDFLTSRLGFAELPEKLVETYREGFALIASMLPSNRYPNITINSLVGNYNSALQGTEGYQLDPECLIYHRNNLRWPDLCQIFLKNGLENIGEWVSANEGMIEHFLEAPSRVADKVSSRLAEFIQYRNDCSHGVVGADEILGHDELIDLADFTLALANALDQLVTWKKLERLVLSNDATVVGHVTERFPRANAFICASAAHRYDVGQTLYIRRGANLAVQEIRSLRVDDVSVPTVEATPGMEVGIQCDSLPWKGSKILIIT